MIVKCAPRLATILCLYKHKASEQASKRRGRVFSILIPTSYTTKRASSHLVGQVGNANTVREGRSHCAQERCRTGDEGGEERGGRRRRGDRERDNDGRTGCTNSSRGDPWRCLLLFVACGRNAGASIPCLPSLPLLWPQLVSHSKEIWLITFAILIPACVNAVPTRYMVS